MPVLSFARVAVIVLAALGGTLGGWIASVVGVCLVALVAAGVARRGPVMGVARLLVDSLGRLFRRDRAGRRAAGGFQPQLSDIEAGIARYNPAQAEAFAGAAAELARSGDKACLRLAATDGPVAAADALVIAARADPRGAAARLHQAARFYAPFAPDQARTTYAEALRHEPDTLWCLIELGRLDREGGDLVAARAGFDRAWALAPALRDQGVLHREFGDLLRASGDGAGARARYDQALAIAQIHAGTDPHDRQAQRDLA